MASKIRDLYEVLGLARNASDKEIKTAYYKLARAHHPDLHPEKEKDRHTQLMQDINEAYSVLSNKESREKYDQYGEHWKEGASPQQERGPTRPPTRESEEDFSEFFQHMFRQRDTGDDSNQEFPSDLDIEASLSLSLEEAVRGGEKSFSLMATSPCQNCHGTGQKGKTNCPVCGGVGEVQRQREIKTKIPAGINEGTRIRLRKQGNDSAHGTGDLYLNIHLSPHAAFKVDGKNLEIEIRIMPWQAALGSFVMTQTLEGPVRIRIPKGTHSGVRLRLGEKGLGKPGMRGDLFARIIIDIPKTFSPKAESLLKQLAEEFQDKPI